MLEWGACILGVVLIIFLYAIGEPTYIWYAGKHASTSGFDLLDGTLIAVPPTEIALAAGGAITAVLSGHQRVAMRWCVLVIYCSVVLDVCLSFYFQIRYYIV
jgi:hypothetical protein